MSSAAARDVEQSRRGRNLQLGAQEIDLRPGGLGQGRLLPHFNRKAAEERFVPVGGSLHAVFFSFKRIFAHFGVAALASSINPLLKRVHDRAANEKYEHAEPDYDNYEQTHKAPGHIPV